jgi:uncharacterized protein HemX
MPFIAPLLAAGLVSVAVGLGSSIYGGIKAGQERRRMEKYLNQQQAENKA